VDDAELRGEVIELVGEQVAVSIHRDLDARVTEVMLDRFRVDALADQETRACVPKMVDADRAGESRGFERRPPHAPSEVRNAQGATRRRRKDE
jgi:hypothetical protein